MKIDCIITSCDRHDLLDSVLESLFNFAGSMLGDVIVFEDSDNVDSFRDVCGKYDVVPVSVGRNIGQVLSIDQAMQYVKTDLYLHLEDDFLMVQSGFLEDASSVLESRKDIIQVNGRGRERKDMNGHPNEGGILNKDYHGWSGWCYAPTLNYRLSYLNTGGYGEVSKFNSLRPWESEKKIGRSIVKDKFAYLTEKKYFTHIGNNRSTYQR